MHRAEIDAAGPELGKGVDGKGIRPDSAEKPDVGTGPPGGQRLVGTLAAGRRQERAARYGLTRRRQPADLADKVEIDGTEDRDHASTLSMVFQLRIVTTRPLGNALPSGSSPSV